jgi:hypothetical protein
MKNGEVNIFKVILSAELTPSPEISMKIFKGKGAEQGNSYLVTSMGLTGKKEMMEDFSSAKTITKSNLMKTSGYGNADSASISLWCLEEQLLEAKEVCMERMNEIVRRNLDQATRMSIMLQAYKHESKK